MVRDGPRHRLAIRDQMMAERQRPSGKKRASRPVAGHKRAETGARAAQMPADPATRIRTLEAERDSLTAELEAAKSRIAALEQAREQVLNRIDWVIDSLHSLSGE